MTGSKKRASIQDVATLAGVSVGSVSRVLNKNPSVSPAIGLKVMEAMEVLQFRLNHAAQALRSRSSMTLGCMFTDVTNPIYAHLFRVFEDKLREHGYIVLLANSLNDRRREIETLVTFRDRGMDGVLVAPGNERDPEVLSMLESLEIPAVVLDRDVVTRHDQVHFDHAEGVRRAVLHLIDLGHQDIALAAGGSQNRPLRRRLEGFNAAFAERRLPQVDPRLIVRSETANSLAFPQVHALLQSGARPSAIVAIGSSVLADVLNAIQVSGLRIPQDISVVSLGAPEFARSHVPQLSTVTVDPDLAATESIRLLMERIRGHAGDSPRIVTIPAKFSDRGSCAPFIPF